MANQSTHPNLVEVRNKAGERVAYVVSADELDALLHEQETVQSWASELVVQMIQSGKLTATDLRQLTPHLPTAIEASLAEAEQQRRVEGKTTTNGQLKTEQIEASLPIEDALKLLQGLEVRYPSGSSPADTPAEALQEVLGQGKP